MTKRRNKKNKESSNASAIRKHQLFKFFIVYKINESLII